MVGLSGAVGMVLTLDERNDFEIGAVIDGR